MLLVCLALAEEETMESMDIMPNSAMATVFQTSDLDGDTVLRESELTAFQQQAMESLAKHWAMASFDLTLFSEPGCAGDSRVVTAGHKELRCSECFDICGNNFSSGSPTSEEDRSTMGAVTSKVRSMRVTAGLTFVVMNFCIGAYNYGTNDVAGSRVISSRNQCVDFGAGEAVAHVAAIPQDIKEVIAAQFLKQDSDDDNFLSAVESPGLASLGLLADADTNQDGLLGVEEYAAMLMHTDALLRTNETVQLSVAAMKDAAVTAMGLNGTSLSDSEQGELARSMFGDAYEAALADPLVTTAAPTGANGQVIVTSQYAHHSDYGDVKDESPVDGLLKNHQDSRITLCTRGRYFEAGSCYKHCKFTHPIPTLSQCFQLKCKDGWKEVAGGMCQKKDNILNTKPKGSYSRGSGKAPETCKLGDSFGPGAQEDNRNRDFSVIMASDVQLPWCHKEETRMDYECATEDNWYMIQGMKSVKDLTWAAGPQDSVASPKGVFIAGDLTAYGSTKQYHLYRHLWEEQEDESSNKNNKFPIWPSLGNHDYTNNINGCGTWLEEPTWAPYINNGCAQRMLTYIRAAVGKCGGETVVKSFGGHVDHYDKDSAAYTVRYGRIRFVQLHNYPTYRRHQLEGMSSTIGFLKEEVEEANKNDDYLVLVMHDMGGHFSPQAHDDQVERFDYFSEIMQNSRTLAVFAGHLHPTGGMKTGYLRDSRTRNEISQIQNAWGEDIPIIRNWGSSEQKFVVTQWNIARCYWRFGSVRAPGKNTETAWLEPEEEEQMRSFEIPNCTIDWNYTPPVEDDIGVLSAATEKIVSVTFLLVFAFFL